MSKEIISLIEEKSLIPLLDNNDYQQILKYKEELKDSWTKKQIYRTETEMRVSVLNDAKFPTNAGKYWQCVREQDVMFGELMRHSFEHREKLVELKKLKRKFDIEKDDLELEALKVQVDKLNYECATLELASKDRIREIEHWSRIKKELDDGSFDTKNVNTHQKKSLELYILNREKSLTEHSAAADIFNVEGQLNTIKRLKREKYLSNENSRKQIKPSQSNSGKIS